MDNQQPAQPTPTIAPRQSANKSLKWQIILMTWPAIVFIAAVLLFAINNFISAQYTPQPADGELFGPTSLVASTINVILFLAGTLSVTVGPISFIAGLIWFIVDKTEKKHA